MHKTFVANRKMQKMSVLVEETNPNKGLVFIMHGLGGFKEQPQILAFNDVFRKYGFTTVRFDTTNSIGESDGKFEDATITNYYEDLEDVIAWAQDKPWYEEPFVLVGHSQGSICTALYAEKNPTQLRALVSLSPIVSGKLTVEAHNTYKPDEFREWQKTGWLTQESVSKPGLMKRLPWSHITDRLQYDLMPDTKALTMPFLTVVGEHDTSTPPGHVKLLFDAVPGPKEMHIIQGASHTFRDPKHLDNIQKIIGKWIEKYLIK